MARTTVGTGPRRRYGARQKPDRPSFERGRLTAQPASVEEPDLRATVGDIAGKSTISISGGADPGAEAGANESRADDPTAEPREGSSRDDP